MKILFVTSTRIGDAVLSTGVLKALLDRYPHAKVTVACGPAAAGLFEAVPNLQTIHAIKKGPKAQHWRELWKRTILNYWDIVVDIRSSALAYLLLAGKRYVFRPDKVGEGHKVWQLASVLAAQDNPPAPHLWLGDKHIKAALALIDPQRPLLAIGPTANWIGKQWAGENFLAVITELTRQGPLQNAQIAVFGAPNERDAAKVVLDGIDPDCLIDVVGKIDLLTAAAMMQQARLYVGNDSGLMHMAAAMNCPTIGLFGPSLDQLYAPWGPHTRVVRTPQSLHEIRQRPDYDYKNTVKSYMDGLTPDRVVAAALDLLAETDANKG